MPGFINALCIRYFFVALAMTVALVIITFLLVHYGVVDDIGASGNVGILAGSGIWAGTYFRKEHGRVASWGESWQFAGILTVVQALLTVLLFGVFTAVGGIPLSSIVGFFTEMTVLSLLAVAALGLAICWIPTALFFRMGSKQAPKQKKA
ncbi:ABZJ_00895 family protein [Rhizobium sp. 18065]|uniref:ABZJ_00895 family protein n=1 Tax=Rhizobium sp. 18065 TaxID=2681411 RepID=UPI001359D415|nr:ABZJ_00895 family protein [Rhizobium sp. 18065]